MQQTLQNFQFATQFYDHQHLDLVIKYYDHRYEQGYMEEWPENQKRKMLDVLQSLNLPNTGTLLDFGCGNGVFTNLLQTSLPGWKIFGVDVSPLAIYNASKKYPGCTFFTVDKMSEYSHFFDFVFSHHVLEHVTDIEQTINDIDSYVKPGSYQLHILPCGNPESFEYKLCLLHKNGIEDEKGSRFFFEDDGHLRRLTSSQLTSYFAQKGYALKKQFYANQYYGALNWISKSSPRFVKKITDPCFAIDEAHKQKILAARKQLLKSTYIQYPYSKYWQIKTKWNKNLSDKLKLMLLLIPAYLSKPTYMHYEKLALKEWNERKDDPRGSEMYLYFERPQAKKPE